MRNTMMDKIVYVKQIRISMKQENRQNQYAEFSMTISTSRELWCYLFRGQKNSSKKLTRIEAFHDLIERQYAALQEESEYIFGSISSLSRAWHWDRDTTSAFITDLEEFGVVSRYDMGKRAVLKLNCTIG